MKTAITPEEFQKILNAIKATHYLIAYCLDNGEYQDAEVLAKKLEDISQELTRYRIKEYSYL